MDRLYAEGEARRTTETMTSLTEQQRQSVEGVSSAVIEVRFGDDSNRAADVVDGATSAVRCSRPSSSLDVITLYRDVDDKSDKVASTLRHQSHDYCRLVHVDGESLAVIDGNHDDDAGGHADRASPYRNRRRCSSTHVDAVGQCRQSQLVANGQRSESPKLLRRLRHVMLTVGARRGRAASWPSPSARTHATANHLDVGDVEHAEVVVDLPDVERYEQIIQQQQNESECRSRVVCGGVDVLELDVNVTATDDTPHHRENSVIGGAVEPSTCVVIGCDRNDARSNFVDGLSVGSSGHLRRYSKRCAALFASVRCLAAMTLVAGLVGVAAGVTVCINNPEYTLGYALFGIGTAFTLLLIFLLKCWNDGREPFQLCLGIDATHVVPTNHDHVIGSRLQRQNLVVASAIHDGPPRCLSSPWRFPSPPPTYDEVVPQDPPAYECHNHHLQQQQQHQQLQDHRAVSSSTEQSLQCMNLEQESRCPHREDGVFHVQVNVDLTLPSTPPPPYRGVTPRSGCV